MSLITGRKITSDVRKVEALINLPRNMELWNTEIKYP